MEKRQDRRNVIENDARDVFGLTVSELSRQWRIFVDQRVAEYGLTSVRCSVLATLNFEGPRSQVELARHLGVKAPSMVRQIDKLEKNGFIKRSIHPEDRRVKIVTLADDAHNVCDRIRDHVHESRDAIFEGLSPEDIKTAHYVLLAIRDNIMRMHAEKGVDSECGLDLGDD